MDLDSVVGWLLLLLFGGVFYGTYRFAKRYEPEDPPVDPARMTIPQQNNEENGGPSEAPFFAVSLLKIVVLSICTLGLYELYWFYRNWQLIKDREATDISPFWRAFLAVFYCYQCFSRIRDFGAANGIRPGISAGVLAAGWIITELAGILPDPYWLSGFFAIVFLLPVQAYANRVNKVAAPQHDPNSRFTPWNWVAVVVGGLLFALMVVGLLFPEE